jgi:hypothetical protein
MHSNSHLHQAQADFIEKAHEVSRWCRSDPERLDRVKASYFFCFKFSKRFKAERLKLAREQVARNDYSPRHFKYGIRTLQEVKALMTESRGKGKQWRTKIDDWIQEVEKARHRAGLPYDSGRRLRGACPTLEQWRTRICWAIIQGLHLT